ncbi:DUF421 domain-containing protein [Sporolactobacillus kofuensis]|uniref:DUF421 domain-containing protein n=1 Tax=Sporolactobacillus kofuensis TaxID=269672 RepID=A0ABW1WAA4_9BACL|nr:DUF421 domain-containing protein [Sporolactobacillus kofuensis]MCO7175604.1 DUF421 domain-containing protein [Sporolactobacillus kofuensis]
MGTSSTRIIVLALLMFFGFRKSLSTKMSDQSCSEVLMIFSAVEFAVAAILQPYKPLLPILVPLLILICFYRGRFLCYRIMAEWSNRNRLIEFLDKHELKKKRQTSTKHESAINEPPRMGIALIEDGKVRGDHLKQIGKTPLWLRQELRKFGYRNLRQVNYLTMDLLGNFYMDVNKRLRKD